MSGGPREAALTSSRTQVLAFRLRRQHLDARLPAGSVEAAVGGCGVRNSPPGSADAALAARVDGLAPGVVAAALTDASLVEVLGPRLVPTLAVRGDVAVLTMGAMPATESGLRDLIGQRIAKAITAAGISLTDAVEQVSAAARDELAGGPRTRGQLSAALTRRLPEPMSAWCPRCGSHHLHETLFRTPGGAGVFCVELRAGREVSFVRIEDRLGTDPLDLDDAEPARLELVRRFLRCYGPARTDEFASWTSTGPAEARRRWRALAGELVDVAAGNRTGSLLAEDAAQLREATRPQGVRLLPPGDPYLLGRDRDVLVPNAAARAVLWRPVGTPGAVLRDGALVGTWRAQRKGTALQLQVTPFDQLPATATRAIQAEAEILAPHRSCATAAVTVA